MILRCVSCGIQFISISSPFCEECRPCENPDQKKSEKNTTRGEDSSFKNSGKILSFEKNSTEKEKKNGLTLQRTTKRSSAYMTEKDTTKTEAERIKDVPRTEEKTRIEKMQDRENTMPITEKSLSSRSTTPEILESPTEGSDESSRLLKTEISRSIHSLTNLEQKMFQTMEGLTRNEPDTAIKLYDVDRAMASVKCAETIISSKRMKLKLFKFARQLKG